ncbi:MAG: chemotaxis protein MotB [Clostridia bacterium]|nr:chemotaxis protein MotB [Clostridia bacterium]
MTWRERKKRREEDGAPTWMTTYSDLMTLLLVFFVLLFSFSQIDIQKFRRFILSYQGRGILDRGTAPLAEPEPLPRQFPEGVNVESGSGQADQLLETYTQVREFLKANNMEDQVEVTYQRGGVALDIKERILFDSGKADLKPEAKNLLDKLAGLLRSLPNDIRVEGHTDSRPIHTVEFPTNWELSAARAARVVRYFTEEHGLDPRRFMAVGYGEFHPLVPNTSPENMALNRRVILLITAGSTPAGGEREVYERAR